MPPPVLQVYPQRRSSDLGILPADPKVGHFVLLRHGPLVPIRIKSGLFVFKVSCSLLRQQTDERTDGRTDGRTSLHERRASGGQSGLIKYS